MGGDTRSGGVGVQRWKRKRNKVLEGVCKQAKQKGKGAGRCILQCEVHVTFINRGWKTKARAS